MNRPPASAVPQSPPVRALRAVEASSHNAAICQEFLRLTRDQGYSLTGAANLLGRSPSYFSGPCSALARYVSGGAAALAPRHRSAEARSEFSRQLEALPWLLPAARFIYQTRQRRGNAFAHTIRSLLALPRLPIGWKAPTRAAFIKAIGLAAVPTLPAELKESILERARTGQPLVPGRFQRLVSRAPARVFRYRFETVPGAQPDAASIGGLAAQLAAMQAESPASRALVTVEVTTIPV